MSKCAFCGVQTGEGICASCLDYRFPHLSGKIKQVLKGGDDTDVDQKGDDTDVEVQEVRTKVEWRTEF